VASRTAPERGNGSGSRAVPVMSPRSCFEYHAARVEYPVSGGGVSAEFGAR
jgi:hypothetical protein